MSGAGDCRQTQGSARRLYCSLSLLEMSLYTATWICGVLYSLYTLYLASLDQVNISKQTLQSSTHLTVNVDLTSVHI